MLADKVLSCYHVMSICLILVFITYIVNCFVGSFVLIKLYLQTLLIENTTYQKILWALLISRALLCKWDNDILQRVQEEAVFK